MDTTQDKQPNVELFTDGACIGNPGPGGWAFILRHPTSGKSKEGCGGEQATTNNRMEITAVLSGLEALRAPSAVLLTSDSLYVIKAINEWMVRWQAYGWRKGPRAKVQIKNVDLWQRLYQAIQPHAVTTRWVKGHAGHPENERCDLLAAAQAAKMAAMPPRPGIPGIPGIPGFRGSGGSGGSWYV